MRSKVTLRNKSIDNAGIPSDYKLAIAEYIWNSFDKGYKCEYSI